MMIEIALLVLLAALLAWVLYAAAEWYEILSAHRNAPRAPVSGPESVAGKQAVVCRNFEHTAAGALCGKVRFEGEEWRAEFAGTDAPTVGQMVVVTGMDAGRLILKVGSTDGG